MTTQSLYEIDLARHITSLRTHAIAMRKAGQPCKGLYTELYRINSSDRKGILELVKEGHDVLDLDTLLYSSLEVQKSLVDNPHIRISYKFPVDFWVRRAQMALGWEMNLPIGVTSRNRVGVEWSYGGKQAQLVIVMSNALSPTFNPETLIKLYSEEQIIGTVDRVWTVRVREGDRTEYESRPTIDFLDECVERVKG